MITGKQVKDTIQKCMDDAQADLTLATEIMETLRPFVGKKITKRMATAVEKIGYTVYYDTSYSWRSLKVWGKGIKMDDRKSFNLGYFSESENFSIEIVENQRGFKELNACYLEAAEERINKNLQVFLNKEQCNLMARKLNAYVEAVEQYKDMDSYEFPALYSVQKLVGEHYV